MIRIAHIEPSGPEPHRAIDVGTTHWYTTLVDRHPNPFLRSKLVNVSVFRADHAGEFGAVRYNIKERKLSDDRMSTIRSGTIPMDSNVREHLEEAVNDVYNGNWLKRLALRNGMK